MLPLSARCTRRSFPAIGAALLASACRKEQTSRPLAEDGDRWARFPGKVPLRLLTDRPPQLETPLRYLREDLTPNEAFFVRWHVAGIPSRVDLAQFRLSLRGSVERPASWTLDELRHGFEPVSLIAVNQCSGNSRSLFVPRVPGGQWRHGAIGNARWTGVRLRDLLATARMRARSTEVTFRGLDVPPLASVPAFVKSLPLEQALHPDVLVAYEMNGQPLPLLNGFPLRLVVPGWYATYWVKALSEITLLDQPFHGFWMDKAYRIPRVDTAGGESPGRLAEDTVPIHRMRLRSLIVRPEPSERLGRDVPYEVQGVALDSGHGITGVEVSVDGGREWKSARLDPDLGRYSWRRWRFVWRPTRPGRYALRVRAFNRAGEQQSASFWNHAGYLRNTVEETSVEVA